MGMLINIDNGGTLTDICVSDGARVWGTKILTTPFDLSRCLIDGLTKASTAVYGSEDLAALLLATDHIRYSTTQGTNAIVERKGPRLGLICDAGIDPAALSGDLFGDLVGERVAVVATAGDALRGDAVHAVADLAARGANRIVVAFAGPGREAAEKTLKNALLRAFPPHLLGAVPILYSHEIAADDDDLRRTWTALLNAYLHPAMERFLYAAEHKLRAARAQRPLLVFRNDGQSARVARTVALKTYSSGPRGGAEGARMLATHYGHDRLVSVDIGGTTTDVSIVEAGVPRAHDRGRVAGVATSFPLTDVASIGVGGSSIIRVENGRLAVGPRSVGSTPGPACFGLGGTAATITDAFFAAGLLDPATFFGGAMAIDVARAVRAVDTAVAAPLGLDGDAAIAAMEAAWVATVADGIDGYAGAGSSSGSGNGPGTVLAAFGGAGPFVICRIAAAVGIDTVLIPKLAAIFSAFGIGFSDIGESYEAAIASAADIEPALAALRQRAARGMASEAIALGTCEETLALVVRAGGAEQVVPFAADMVLPAGNVALRLDIVHRLPHPELTGVFGGDAAPAIADGTRTLLIAGNRQAVPLYRTATLFAGAGAAGPAVLEDEYFTCRIDAGWRFDANAAGDLRLTRTGAGA